MLGFSRCILLCECVSVFLWNPLAQTTSQARVSLILLKYHRWMLVFSTCFLLCATYVHRPCLFFFRQCPLSFVVRLPSCGGCPGSVCSRLYLGWSSAWLLRCILYCVLCSSSVSFLLSPVPFVFCSAPFVMCWLTCVLCMLSSATHGPSISIFLWACILV